MTEWLSDQEQRAWRGLVRMTSDLWAAVGRDLQAAGLSTGEYEVLVCLSETEGHRLRVTRLARMINWERSRLSHQLSRMEKRGLIVRADCPEDARGGGDRGQALGRHLGERAAPSHVASVRRHLFDALSAQQVAQLTEISETILDGLDQSSGSGMNGST